MCKNQVYIDEQDSMSLLQDLLLTHRALLGSFASPRLCFPHLSLWKNERLRSQVNTIEFYITWGSGSQTQWCLRNCLRAPWNYRFLKVPFGQPEVALAPVVLCPVRFWNPCPGPLRPRGLAISHPKWSPLPCPAALWVVPGLLKPPQNLHLHFPFGDPWGHRALRRGHSISPAAKWTFPALHAPRMLKRVKPGKSCPSSEVKQSYSSVFRVILHFRGQLLVLLSSHYLGKYFPLSFLSTDDIWQTKLLF